MQRKAGKGRSQKAEGGKFSSAFILLTFDFKNLALQFSRLLTLSARLLRQQGVKGCEQHAGGHAGQQRRRQTPPVP